MTHRRDHREIRRFPTYRLIGLGLIGFFLCPILPPSDVAAQGALRDSLERLDQNRNGIIEPEEISPMARNYLAAIAKSGRLSLSRANSIDAWQEAARTHHAAETTRRMRRIEIDGSVPDLAFGAEKSARAVPEFGDAEIRYPFTNEDWELAASTLRRYDRNKDGYLDLTELAEARWSQRNPLDDDLDNDGRLSQIEMAQRYARRRMLAEATNNQIRREVTPRPTSYDDQASPESETSFTRRRSDRRAYLASTLMYRFDANRDGRLDAVEAAKIGLPFSQIDIDRDGEISRRELEAYMLQLQEDADEAAKGLPSWFFERDANQDGQISMSEFADEWTEELIEEFNALDLNGDGMLTAAEARLSKSLIGGQYTNTEAEVLAPGKTLISEIVVEEDFLIRDIDIQLSITHTYTGHLSGYLIGPDGQRIELFASVGGSDDHFDQTIFDDQANTSITRARPPFNGRFQPGAVIKRQKSLSHFNGSNIQGVWQLVISGSRSDRFGMLHGWGMLVKPE